MEIALYCNNPNNSGLHFLGYTKENRNLHNTLCNSKFLVGDYMNFMYYTNSYDFLNSGMDMETPPKKVVLCCLVDSSRTDIKCFKVVGEFNNCCEIFNELALNGEVYVDVKKKNEVGILKTLFKRLLNDEDFKCKIINDDELVMYMRIFFEHNFRGYKL